MFWKAYFIFTSANIGYAVQVVESLGIFFFVGFLPVDKLLAFFVYK